MGNQILLFSIALGFATLILAKTPRAEAGGCVPRVAVVGLPLAAQNGSGERGRLLAGIHGEFRGHLIAAVTDNPNIELAELNLNKRAQKRLLRLLRPTVRSGSSRPPKAAYQLANSGTEPTSEVDTVIVFGIDLGKERSFRMSVLGLYGGTMSLHFESDTIFSRSPDQEPEGPALGAILARAAEQTHKGVAITGVCHLPSLLVALERPRQPHDIREHGVESVTRMVGANRLCATR